MRRIDLAGDWTVRKAGAKKSIQATVPGCVQADLLAALEIENPFVRKNLENVAWIAASEWVYEKMFVSEDMSAFDCLVLRFEGLSAGATVSLNDQVLGRTSSRLEAVEFDVRALVKVGKNRLTVVCSPLPDTRVPQAAANGASALPVSSTVGIWRGVSLLAFTGIRVNDVLMRQDFSVSGVVGLDVAVTTERYGPEVHLEILVRVCYKGNILHEARDILSNDQMSLHLTIKNPQFWWPVGLGEQPLYEVTVDVLAGRTCLEHVSRRIGLRQFAVERTKEKGKSSCRFFINRHPIFFKGASWLPADLYVGRMTRVEYARLVKAAAVANMNVLRVWGGGLYENDAFYDLCDEYGICVWQDMMQPDEQSAEPSPVQLAAYQSEVRQNIQRLRHHPSLVLWCEGHGDAASAYGKRAVQQVEALDPDGVCLPAMPHVPFSLDGDAAFEPLSSYPEPRAVAGYLGEEDRNVSHPVCAYHMATSDGARRIYNAFLDQFLLPSGFENTLWLSQVQQGFVLKQQFERVRMGERSPAGFLYWHLNDSWPVCSPSSVDHEGRWKAAHYMMRRFFAPTWLCGGYHSETGCVDVHTFNDGVRPFKGELQWRLTQMEGSVVVEGSKKVAMLPAARERPTCVKVADALRKFGAGNLLLWIYLLDEQGNQVAWNFVLLCAPRELALQPPRMRAEIRNWDDNSFAVTLTSHRPAMWVWITLEGMEARYDDNFFCLEPEKSVRVRVTPSTRIKLDQFRQIVRIGSLRDTWQEKRSLMQMMAAANK